MAEPGVVRRGPAGVPRAGRGADDELAALGRDEGMVASCYPEN